VGRPRVLFFGGGGLSFTTNIQNALAFFHPLLLRDLVFPEAHPLGIWSDRTNPLLRLPTPAIQKYLHPDGLLYMGK